MSPQDDRRGPGGPGRGQGPGRRGTGPRRDGGRDGDRRGGQRRPSRPRGADPARLAAYDVLREVEGSDAYANLVLPGLLRERRITGRDAAFATELAYGTLRMRGRYDAVLARCTNDRPLAALDPEVLDILRLGAHQLLGMRVPAHAAVAETVGLARHVLTAGPAGLVNAVLRTVGRRSVEEWLTVLAEAAGDDDVARLSAVESHPEWITRAMRQALLAAGRPAAELGALLAADNDSPRVTLVARPGLVTRDELADQVADRGGQRPEPGRFSPYALVLPGGDPAGLPAVRDGAAGVQDEGSQLVALALAAAPLDGPDTAWADLCAGPGGKAALLGALAAARGGALLANEVAPHRARLVRSAAAGLPPGVVTVRTGDGRELGASEAGRFDRVLVDAPCTGLGSLRRRPESRWRRTPADLAGLAPLQRELLTAALAAVRPGGVVAYTTCSPHVAETRVVVEDVLRRTDGAELLDASGALTAAIGAPVPDAATGPYVQLWPHRHGTDAMFLALLRRTV